MNDKHASDKFSTVTFWCFSCAVACVVCGWWRTAASLFVAGVLCGFCAAMSLISFYGETAGRR